MIGDKKGTKNKKSIPQISIDIHFFQRKQTHQQPQINETNKFPTTIKTPPNRKVTVKPHHHHYIFFNAHRNKRLRQKLSGYE